LCLGCGFWWGGGCHLGGWGGGGVGGSMEYSTVFRKAFSSQFFGYGLTK